MHKMMGRVLVIIFVIVVGCADEAVANQDRRQLTRHLLDNCEHVGCDLGIPTRGERPLDVLLGMKLIRLSDFDHTTGKTRIRTKEIMTWSDYILRWEPELFGDVEQVHVPQSRIWLPDVKCDNSLDAVPIRDVSIPATVMSDGNITWSVDSEHNVVCYRKPGDDATTFQDEEGFLWDWKCMFNFVSSTYRDNELVVHPLEQTINMGYYHGESRARFLVTATRAKDYRMFDPCCTHGRQGVTFVIFIQDRERSEDASRPMVMLNTAQRNDLSIYASIINLLATNIIWLLCQ